MNRNISKIKLICVTCKKEFLIWPYERNYRKYCSRDCRKKTKIVKKCSICEKEFKVRKERIKTAKYCSYICMGLARREKMKGNKYRLNKSPQNKQKRIIKNCLTCKKDFAVSSYRIRIGKGNFCNKLCWSNRPSIKKSQQICMMCKKNFHSPTKSIFCSQKCYGLYNRGEKNHLWRGGLTPENTKIRNSIESRLWRESVFARDNFTCQKYGIKGGRLVAHHIQNFAQFPELRFAIDNGITFCKNCHKEFHKKYGIKNNTKEQIEEFLKEQPTNIKS